MALVSLELAVGPPRLAISHGYGVLVTNQDGTIDWPTEKGFYHSDTRLISSWQIYADGEPWTLLNGGAIDYFASHIYLTNAAITTKTGVIAAGSLELTISRCIDGGVHEDLDLINHGQQSVRFNLELAVRSDFADMFEIKSHSIVRRGHIDTIWSNARSRLKTIYNNEDFHRSLIITAREFGSKPSYANGRISFEIELAPGGSWHTCLLYAVGNGQSIDNAPRNCLSHAAHSDARERLNDWQDVTLKIESSSAEFDRYYQQSLKDMASLRLPIGGTSHIKFVPGGGMPWFLALFGRDSLIAALQCSIIHPHSGRGCLEVLSRHQAVERDDWRDAEPGKILHELRLGELAHCKLIPHTPYFGSADATILFLLVLHQAWLCTDEVDLLESYMPAAEGCLRWIDEFGDRDGDGFQEYQTRSKAGYENQGWKDAGDALVNTDGSLVKGPKALVELQGYVYDAWIRMAQIYDFLRKPARARALRKKAKALFIVFNESFWDEDLGFYAFCLDGEKKKVMSIASNPGHCLWSGIVPPERAKRVVSRLMAPDMWSGWGIRTLSADHPAYNPNSYQNGSVWPHDNAIIALGFRRYGFTDEAARIARGVSDAAACFSQHQLPELYSGKQREPTSFPIQYLGANTPQAWAAGSCFTFLQMMVGFSPDAPAGRLYLDPQLPDWLPQLTLRHLQVGKNGFDLRFTRDKDGTRIEVLNGDAAAIVRRSYATGAGDLV